MTDELRVGDRVKSICHEGGTLLGFHTNREGQRWAWVEWDDMAECYGCQLQDLTRISPDVPQPKYRVGQRVAIKNGQKDHLEIAEIEYHYRLRCLPHNAGLDGEIEFKGGLTHCTYSEADLGAVPDEVVCPTCGGKVADG